MNKRRRVVLCFGEIYLLVISILAFGFMLSGTGFVSAVGDTGDKAKIPETGEQANKLTFKVVGGNSKVSKTLGGSGTQTYYPVLGNGQEGSIGNFDASYLAPGETLPPGFKVEDFRITKMIAKEGGGGTLVSNYGNVKVSSDGFNSVRGAVLDSGTGIIGPKFGYDNPYKIPMLGTEFTGVTAHLAQGMVWSVVAIGATQLVGSFLGLDKKNVNALTYSALGGIWSSKILTIGAEKGFFGQSSFAKWLTGTKGSLGGAGLIGIGVAIAIFIASYKKETKMKVNFICHTWEPQLGGGVCEQCNKDPLRPCSEYRCRSLGQACELLNVGTNEERCAWVGRDDVNSPTITPWNEALKPSDLKYVPDTTIRPPNKGVTIVKGANGCLEPYTALQFGLSTNEPSKCKIDFSREVSYEEMQYYFGESVTYKYNHTQAFRLPSPNDEGVDLSPLLENDGTFNYYVRCQDANGNYNVDAFVFNFCVDESPDTTPPIIEGSSINTGGAVQYNADKVPIEVYINEPATCKWSRQSKSYEDMENSMTCGTESYQINADLQYTCSGDLTGISNNADNKFYFRCEDKSSNVNVQSYELILKGSQPLNILRVEPNATISGSTETVPVTLYVKTDDGADEGVSICYFSATGGSDSYIAMFDTNNYEHRQKLDLDGSQSGTNYSYYFSCIDAFNQMNYFYIMLAFSEQFLCKGVCSINNVKMRD